VFQERTLAYPHNAYSFVKGVAFFALFFYVLVLQGCGSLVHHKVENGDSLYSIGFYYGHDYRDIAKWNDIPAPYVIQEGQWLRVAPPDQEWWAERAAQRKRNNSKSNRPKSNRQRADAKNNKNTNKKNNDLRLVNKIEQNKRKSTRQSTNTTRKVLEKDFTDRSGEVSGWVWPTKGRLINANKPFSQRGKGIDIGGQRGQLVYATAKGKVVYGGNGLIGYGNLIILKHNKAYLSAYAHNEKILVKEGDIVQRGQKIARMGLTPDKKIQLHFEIRRNGKPVDPLRYLKN